MGEDGNKDEEGFKTDDASALREFSKNAEK
jgi:hypothetical protein